MRCCRCVVCVTKVGMFDDSSAAVKPARPLEAGGVAVPITIITFLHLSLSRLFVFLTQNIIRSASHLGNSDEKMKDAGLLLAQSFWWYFLCYISAVLPLVVSDCWDERLIVPGFSQWQLLNWDLINFSSEMIWNSWTASDEMLVRLSLYNILYRNISITESRRISVEFSRCLRTKRVSDPFEWREG